MNVVASFPAGKLRVIQVEGGAAVVHILLQPDVGFVWQLLDCWAYHDDTENRTLQFGYSDGVLEVFKEVAGAKAAGIKWHLAASNTNQYGSSIMNLVVISNRVYVTLTADALTAGKKIYIEALVLELAE